MKGELNYYDIIVGCKLRGNSVSKLYSAGHQSRDAPLMKAVRG